jgi:hypothetical protein
MQAQQAAIAGQKKIHEKARDKAEARARKKGKPLPPRRYSTLPQSLILGRLPFDSDTTGMSLADYDPFASHLDIDELNRKDGGTRALLWYTTLTPSRFQATQTDPIC